MTHRNLLTQLLAQRVLILDGSTGTALQALGKQGNHDMLVLTDPATVEAVHRAYLEAGADIIETDTFNSTTVSQSHYNAAHLVDDLNREGARLARRIADEFTAANPAKPRLVAGSMGPTGHALTLSPDVNDPSARTLGFEELAAAYARQARALIEGGVDFLLIETSFDLLNVKAALCGAREGMAQADVEVPIMVSATVSDVSGRLLSGHSLETLVTTVAPFSPAAIGLNCSAGPAGLLRHLRRLSEISPFPTIFYPNAGLPDVDGSYNETPELFASTIAVALSEGLLNIVGGCCGTTAAHIAAVAAEVGRTPQPRVPAVADAPAWLAGSEAMSADRGFINVGERCNVAGSRKFLRLINEKKYDEAVEIARHQVEVGAMMLDINLDDAMLDCEAEMERFVRMLAVDPVASSVPWMIDSSDFSVIAAALRNMPGKGVVNSISLKHGEEEFLREAAAVRAMGCAVVVMAFDERGQAVTFEHKCEVCARAYRLLTEKGGFAPEDIIFDPNVLTVATGMAEHNAYALDFIRAVEWIHANLPGARTSGGVSNLSFAFRGNTPLRQAMHAVFLYHAIKAGLSMAIIDPGSKVTYADLTPEQLTLLEDVILNRRPDAADRLLASAHIFNPKAETAPSEDSTQQEALPPTEEIKRALTTGNDTVTLTLLTEAVAECGSPTALIEGPMMEAMEQVGRRFESGQIFLPQVVRSARVMHRAVDLLKPMMEESASASPSPLGKAGKAVLATVYGDVHDIGKNIAGVVMRCNNFEVIDLGVQVSADAIADAVEAHRPDFLGLSGLITPSLKEMAQVLRTLEARGLRLPVMVGGAATSALHTAVHLAPCYSGTVVRVADASQNPLFATRWFADPEGEARRVAERHAELREAHLRAKAEEEQLPVVKPEIDWSAELLTPPAMTDYLNTAIPLADVRPYINWTYFLTCWRTKPDTEAATQLLAEAEALLDRLEARGATVSAVVANRPAYQEGDSIVVETEEGPVAIDTPRQRPTPNRKVCLSLADFVAPQGAGDHVGAFMVTIGPEIRVAIAEAEASGDEFATLLLKSVADRIAEAGSEWLHRHVRTTVWAYDPEEPLDLTAIRRGKYRGIRPAIGYPSLPDQMMMHRLGSIVNPAEIGVEVTVNGALHPSSTVAGLYFASPRANYFTL